MVVAPDSCDAPGLWARLLFTFACWLQEAVGERNAFVGGYGGHDRPSPPRNAVRLPRPDGRNRQTEFCPDCYFLAEGGWSAQSINEVGVSAHASEDKDILYFVNKEVSIADKGGLCHHLGMPRKRKSETERNPNWVAAGARFKLFREAVLGWSQQKSFARHMGWSNQSQGHYENGVHEFPLDKLQRVETKFGVKLLDWVYNGDIGRLEGHQIDKLNDPRRVPGGSDDDDD